jgi:hypothetical protein
MPIKKEGYYIISGIVLVYLIVTIIKLTIPAVNTFSFFIRLFALWAYIALAIATIMTPWLKEITAAFGKPFLKTHHLFALFGTLFATLHPIVLAIERSSLLVFLPNFDSWELFWTLAGRPALILIYVGLFGVLLRKKITYWRSIHGVMYVMLLMGYVHGILIGTDFQNIGILIIFTLIFAASMISFGLKRWQKYQMELKKKQRTAQKAEQKK